MEKFTNIAGGAFQSYVAKQIETRKKFLAESNIQRENKHLIYLNNKNSWIRLTSCVNVNQDHPLAKKYNLSGDELAKKYILQGGTVKKTENGIINRSGFENDGLYNLLPNKPQGFKPVPGIISIDLSSSGKLGTLQYATIKFICYDLEQLELMDALYMKLGFSLVLEWGHTIYLDNDSSLKTPVPLNVFSFSNKEDLMKAIQKKRVSHSGNYDAMMGTISNFVWEAQGDGSYLCDIKLVGAGDILESLKINQAVTRDLNFTGEVSTFTGSEEDREKLSSQIADKDLSILNQALFSIYQQTVNYSSNKNDGIILVGTQTESYRNLLNRIFTSCPYNFIKFNSNGELEGDITAIKGNHYSLISELNKNNGSEETNIPNNNSALFHSVGVPYQINDVEAGDNSEPQVYITLGHLLALITATGMIYNTTNGKDGKPHIYIDFNDSLNYCATYKGQVSIDPRVCIIPRNQSNEDDPFGLGLVEDRLFNSINNVVIKREYDYKSYSGGIGGLGRADAPTISNITEVKPKGFINNYLNVASDEKDVRARMMYILVNINFITDILRQQRGEDGSSNVNLSDFMNAILEGIGKALCGFNEFRLLIDDSNKCMRIIDDNKTSLGIELNDDNQYTEIPIFGDKSIVYNYSFKSKIGPNMASMVTIAAQANPSMLGEDSFAISNLSRGLLDRIATEKSTSSINTTLPDQPISTKQQKENLKTLKQHIENILGAVGSYVINVPSIDPSLNTYKELLAQYRTQRDSTNKASIIIPLDFSLSMDGLSGIIPQSAFVIPTNLLPSSYKTKDNKPKIAFIIHTINQSFDDNKWITKITGQTINIRFDQEDTQIYSPISSVGLFGNIINPEITPIQQLLNQTCTRRASVLFDNIQTNIPIKLLKDAMNDIGLNSKQAIASIVAIAAGESGLVPKDEKHTYSISRLRQVFPNLTESQYTRATVRGISKNDFFKIVYGEYMPSRVGNRNVSDGGKYYGRGYIQLTGYGNYKKYATLSGIDIVNNPDLVNDPAIGAKISAIYFKDRVKANQYDGNYFEKALNAVGYNVGDIRQKKIEYYNCYINRI